MNALTRRIALSAKRRSALVRTTPVRRRLCKQLHELDARGISFISNNCVAGVLYDWAGRRKQTPTAGIYFTGDSYRLFLDDLSRDRLDVWDNLKAGDLVFNADQSCWSFDRAGAGELVFLHYPSPDEAVAKWNRRMMRLDGRTPLVISSIRDSIALDSLRPVLANFRFTFTVDGHPAPPADDLVLDARFLRPFSDYLDHVLAGDPEARAVREILI